MSSTQFILNIARENWQKIGGNFSYNRLTGHDPICPKSARLLSQLPGSRATFRRWTAVSPSPTPRSSCQAERRSHCLTLLPGSSLYPQTGRLRWPPRVSSSLSFIRVPTSSVFRFRGKWRLAMFFRVPGVFVFHFRYFSERPSRFLRRSYSTTCLKKISQRQTKLAASNPSDILSGDGDYTLHYSIGINGMNQIVIADTCRCMPSTSSFGPTWLTPGSSWLRIWLMPTYSGWPHTSKIIKILGTVFNMRKSCRRFNIDEIIN